MLKNMVLKTAAWELQKALYACLSNNTELMGVVTGGVHDSIVPSGTIWHNGMDGETVLDSEIPLDDELKLPYIVLGDDTISDYSTKTEQGEEFTHTMQVFSEYSGKKEVKQILDLMLRALSAEPLTLEGGFEVDDIRRDYMEIVEDNQYYRGILRLRIKITQV